MTQTLRRRAAAIALACLVSGAIAPLAHAHPYRIDDLLALRTLGPMMVDPGQRWLVIATTAPWSTAPRYDLDAATFEALGQLQVVDLTAPGAPRPLLPTAPGTGYVAGPFSPSGSQMVVFRLRGHARELGVVTLATGQARWLGLDVESAPWGRSVQWRNDDVLLAVARQPGAPSRGLGYGWQVQARLQGAWAKAAAGELAVTPLGAGRYERLNPRVEGERLVAVTLSTGQVRSLIEGEIVDLEIAPDARRAAVVIADQAIAVKAADAVTPSTPWRRRRLRLVDLAEGAVRDPLPGADILSTSLAWSPDGKRLVVFARPDGADWSAGSLREVAADGAVRDLAGVVPKISTARDGEVSVRAGFAGDQLVVFGAARAIAGPDGPIAREGGADTATWRSLDGAAVGLPSGSRFEASDRTGGLFVAADGVFRLEPGRPPRRMAPKGTQLPRPGRATVGVRPEVTPMTRDPLCCAQLSTGALRMGPTALALAPGETVLAYAPARGLAVVEQRDDHGVSTVWLRGARGSRPLLTLNEHLARVDRPSVRLIRHSGPQGQALTSWLYRPANAAPDARLPLIVVPYPGSSYAAEPAMVQPQFPQFSASVQAMVGQGYAVLVPSLPIAPDAEPGAGLAQAILSIVDRAAAEGGVDPGRVALWGQSFGGYGVLMAASQSDRFFAVIASAPVADLASFWGAVPPQVSLIAEPGLPVAALAGWAESGQGRMLGPPWRDPDRWRRNSPLWLADRIVAPVMLVQGDVDADPAQTAMMFQALARQDKDVVWLTYHGEGHVVIGPGNLRDLYRRAFEFLADGSRTRASGPTRQAADR